MSMLLSESVVTDSSISTLLVLTLMPTTCQEAEEVKDEPREILKLEEMENRDSLT